LALQRLEVPLNPVYADRERINQVEALSVLGQDRREHAGDNVSVSAESIVSLTQKFREHICGPSGPREGGVGIRR